jgi:IS6 family transposase
MDLRRWACPLTLPAPGCISEDRFRGLLTIASGCGSRDLPPRHGFIASSARTASPGTSGALTTPILTETARPCRHCATKRWFVDETDVKVSGGGTSTTQTNNIDVFVSEKRDAKAATRSFHSAISAGAHRPIGHPRWPARSPNSYRWRSTPPRRTPQSGRSRPRAREGQAPANHRAQTRPDGQRHHGGHAFIQNVPRGHYELGADAPAWPRPWPQPGTSWRW